MVKNVEMFKQLQDNRNEELNARRTRRMEIEGRSQEFW